MASWFFKRHNNIYIYVPNLIGYLRVICAVYAFNVAISRPYACVLSYLIGFICDDLDGRFARLLNQQSTLGVVLDMVTDRLSTAGLFVLLSMLYPQWLTLFISLLVLDISSHWYQMYYVLTTGKTTHKEVTSKSWLVRSYYKYRLFMGICCISCEVLYLALYLMHWEGIPDVEIHFFEPIESISIPYSLTIKKLCYVFWIAAVAFPGFLMKQVINVFQLKNAMIGLVRHDIQSRTENNKVH